MLWEWLPVGTFTGSVPSYACSSLTLHLLTSSEYALASGQHTCTGIITSILLSIIIITVNVSNILSAPYINDHVLYLCIALDHAENMTGKA